jgi:glyoxylase-like metal-dependent hydrolase (beta-lactamase superfamily II)
MSAERWVVGDVTVTKVYETTLDHERIVDVLPIDAAALAPHREWMGPYLGPNDEMLMSVHAFCLEVDGLRMVVDTCIGNDKHYGDHPMLQIFNGLHTSFLDDLEAAGFGRDDVDVVVCTHLHPDHVGWNTVRVDDVWEPTFRRATYLMSRTDVDAWRTLTGAHNPWPFAIQPLLDHGQLTTVDPPHRVSPSVELLPTPGHTPGHLSVHLASRGAHAFITGDMVHSPVQLVEPDWTYRYDADGAEAAASVRRLVADACATDALVLGTHFPTPTAGRLRRGEGGGLRFV